MKWILFLTVALVIATIGAGFICYRQGSGTSVKGMKKVLGVNVSMMAALVLGAIAMLIPDLALAAEAPNQISQASATGLVAAALSTGLACIGAGYAVGAVGASALGAVLEDPKSLGKSLIFIGLAEGIVIYGLIISIMVLQRI